MAAVPNDVAVQSEIHPLTAMTSHGNYPLVSAGQRINALEMCPKAGCLLMSLHVGLAACHMQCRPQQPVVLHVT